MYEISITCFEVLYVAELLYYDNPTSNAQIIETHRGANFTEVLLYVNDKWEDYLININ